MRLPWVSLICLHLAPMSGTRSTRYCLSDLLSRCVPPFLPFRPCVPQGCLGWRLLSVFVCSFVVCFSCCFLFGSVLSGLFLVFLFFCFSVLWFLFSCGLFFVCFSVVLLGSSLSLLLLSLFGALSGF